MPKVTYHIIEHDGGWAYRVGDVISETFPSHDVARAAAERAAAEQRVGGETTDISYEDSQGPLACRDGEGRGPAGHRRRGGVRARRVGRHRLDRATHAGAPCRLSSLLQPAFSASGWRSPRGLPICAANPGRSVRRPVAPARFLSGEKVVRPSRRKGA